MSCLITWHHNHQYWCHKMVLALALVSHDANCIINDNVTLFRPTRPFCKFCDANTNYTTWHQWQCKCHMLLMPALALVLAPKVTYYLETIIWAWQMQWCHWWHHQHHVTGNMLFPYKCQNQYAPQIPHVPISSCAHQTNTSVHIPHMNPL